MHLVVVDDVAAVDDMRLISGRCRRVPIYDFKVLAVVSQIAEVSTIVRFDRIACISVRRTICVNVTVSGPR